MGGGDTCESSLEEVGEHSNTGEQGKEKIDRDRKGR